MKLAATLSLLAAGALYASASSAAPTCSIEIHPRFNLYVINMGGKPFKNKHYVDYDDAALLQRVLVESGSCVPSQKVAKCDSRGDTLNGNVVRLASAGGKKQRAADPAHLGWSPTDCTAQ